MLEEFVGFQQLINPDRFDFEIQLEKGIDPETEYLPPMLIQPFVENAIRHGLLPLKSKGSLVISFSKTDVALKIEIRDNGIGFENAKNMINQSPMHYISRGTELTMNRVRLLRQLGFKINMETKRVGEITCVTITLWK